MAVLRTTGSSGSSIIICPNCLPFRLRTLAERMLTGKPSLRIRFATTGSEICSPSNTRRTGGVPDSRRTSSLSGATMPNSRRPAADFVWVNTSSTLPSSAMIPPSRIATWVQIWRITAISWVITTMVIPSSLLISCSNFRMDCVVMGSKAEVASSHKSTSGSEASARAMATRWR